MAIEPTQVEKLLIWMLADIGEKVGDNPEDHAFIKEAMFSGNYWAIEWQFPGIFAEATPPEVVKEVVNILDTWSFIEDASNEKFPGFDGNYEGEHLSAARMMTEKMQRFESFKGRVGQGVMGLDGYRGMAERFEVIRPRLDGRGMNSDELREVLGRDPR